MTKQDHTKYLIAHKKRMTNRAKRQSKLQKFHIYYEKIN